MIIKCCLGTAFINAVFYGVKNDGTINVNETSDNALISKEGPCSSSASVNVNPPAPTTTRKHVLQVSTYQVIKSN